MTFKKDDILEALGIHESGFGNWFGPALIGFGVGAFIGAAVALMVAPRSGSELREELLSRGRRFVKRGRETIGENAEELGRSDGPPTSY